MTQRTPLAGKDSFTSPSSAFPTTLSIMARPNPDRSGVLTGGPPRSSQVSFSRSDSQNCQWMRTLVEQQLNIDRSGSQIVIDGEDVMLKPEAVQNLGLALHELATNAQKYGCLLYTSDAADEL